MTEQIYDTKLEELKLYAKNPRVGNIDKIAESLLVNGQYKPIIVRKETGEILAGNHTYQAAQKLGWKKIKVAYVTALTDEQAAKIVLADNKTSDYGEYNNYTLSALLNELGTINGSGYTQSDITKLEKFIINDTAIEGNTDPDDVPRIATRTINQPGDVWELGKHRLVCGSATNRDDYALLLGADTAQMLLTDPPYNVNYTGGNGLTIKNDNLEEEEFKTFLQDFYSASFENMDAGGAAYIFHSDAVGAAFRDKFISAGFDLKEILIWVKNSLVLSRQDYHWQHEPIIYGWKPGAAHNWYGDRKHTTVIDYYDPERMKDASRETLLSVLEAMFATTTIIRHPKPTQSLEHPTMKPVELLEILIKNSSDVGDVILDPFGGSGSTLIAANRTSRKAALIELDPKYCDVICRRWEQHTGIVPKRLNDNVEYTFIDTEAE